MFQRRAWSPGWTCWRPCSCTTPAARGWAQRPARSISGPLTTSKVSISSHIYLGVRTNNMIEPGCNNKKIFGSTITGFRTSIHDQDPQIYRFWIRYQLTSLVTGNSLHCQVLHGMKCFWQTLAMVARCSSMKCDSFKSRHYLIDKTNYNNFIGLVHLIRLKRFST